VTRGSAWRARGPGLTLGSFRGIAFRIDTSWVLIFLLVAWSSAAYFPQALPGRLAPGGALLLGIAASAVLFASIVAHELAHSLVALALGYEVRSITLFIFGGVSEIEDEPASATDELAIAISGPLMSLVVAGAMYVASLALASGGVGYVLLRYLAATNFAIAAFNLFPGFPLDGGRVLRALFRATGDGLVAATRKAALVGRVLGFTLVALGVATFLGGGWLSGAWLGLIGWFLKSSADASYRQVAFRAHAAELRVGEVAERLVPLTPDESIATALLEHGLLGGSTERYPVVAASDRVLGMVPLAALRAVPRERWRDVKVSSVLEAMGPTVSPSVTLLDALEVMTEHELAELPVVDAAGDYAGLVRLNDVVRIGLEAA
jgi:Zn-dependent protease/CBS domain-containing protein